MGLSWWSVVPSILFPVYNDPMEPSSIPGVSIVRSICDLFRWWWDNYLRHALYGIMVGSTILNDFFNVLSNLSYLYSALLTVTFLWWCHSNTTSLFLVGCLGKWPVTVCILVWCMSIRDHCIRSLTDRVLWGFHVVKIQLNISALCCLVFSEV